MLPLHFISCYNKFYVGMVGVSVGVPGKAYALSGAFSTAGKLLVILTFYMGKNRAMPKLSDPVIHFYFPELDSIIQKNKLRAV